MPELAQTQPDTQDWVGYRDGATATRTSQTLNAKRYLHPVAVKAEAQGPLSDPPLPANTSLPQTATVRKALPVWSGVVAYFPDVFAAVAEVSRVGNGQHNPGEPLHWARGKSTDQMDSAFRHMMDHAQGQRLDTDGTRHLAKAIWRLMAELQLTIERERM